MKNYFLIAFLILLEIVTLTTVNGQTTSAANWKWGKDFNPSSASPPKMCFKDGFVYTAGNYISALHIESQTFPNNGGSDIYLAKWDTTGNLIWAETISGIDNQYVSNIHVKDNKIVLTGGYNSSTLQVGSFNITNNGLYDLFIANFDTSGASTALYNYGTVGNEYIRSSCIDNNFNVYIANDSLYKFSVSGIKLWNKNYKVNHVYFSNVDTSIVTDATGPSSIYTSTYNGFTYYYNDIITRKFNLQGDSIWKTTFTITNGHYSNPTYPGTYFSDFNQDDDCLYIGYSNHYHLSLINNAIVNKISPNGASNLVYNYSYPSGAGTPMFLNLSTNKHYIMLTLHGSSVDGTHIFNSNTNGTIKIYANYRPYSIKSYKFIDTNLIFAHGDNGIAQHTFGKFGQDTIQVMGNAINHFCLGATGNLYPTIVGGTPPYSFSWSPTTGLNSATTLNPSLTAITNTTYTLTVTDANNYSYSKAFNVIVDTPINFTISASSLVLCDSVTLFSNSGQAGYWQKYISLYNFPIISFSENLTVYSGGQYYFQLQNSCGLKIDTIDIIQGTTSSSTTISICQNQLPYSWNGQSISLSGLYQDTLINSVGCDSIASLQFTVNPITFSTNSMTVCSNQLPYIWNGQSISLSGLYQDTLINSVGCDSIATLQLAVNPITYSTNSMTVCSNQVPYLWNGQSISQSGLYQDTLINSVGCDSIASLLFTVNPISFSFDTLTVCSNQVPYVWNGQSLSQSGLYQDTLINSVGCDSIAILYFTANSVSFSTESMIVCSNKLPYIWNGQSISLSGLYQDTLINSVGCDSIASLLFTVNPISFSFDTLTVCSNQVPYVWNGQSLSQSGLYQDTLINSFSCDSIASLLFTVNPISISFDTLTVCSNQVPYVWNGQSLNQSGIYQDTLINSAGCDSMATLQLLINPSPQPSILWTNSLLVCTNSANVNYQWYFNNLPIGTNADTVTITQNGLYAVVTTDSLGCIGIDSIHIISLGSSSVLLPINDLKLYPNPTSNSIFIDYFLLKDTKMSLQIVDVVGNVITKMSEEKQVQGQHSKEINLQSFHLSNGVYLLQLSDGIHQWNLPFVYRP